MSVERRFIVKGSLGAGLLTFAEQSFKFVRDSDGEQVSGQWITATSDSPAKLSQGDSDDLESARSALRFERLEQDEDETPFDPCEAELVFTTDRPGPWLTLHTREGEILGFEIARELKADEAAPDRLDVHDVVAQRDSMRAFIQGLGGVDEIRRRCGVAATELADFARVATDSPPNR